MRFILTVAMPLLAAVPAASATTINHFTYNYSLGGINYTTTFSLVDGQPLSSPYNPTSFADTYANVEINDTPGDIANIGFHFLSLNPNNVYGGTYFSLSSPLTGIADIGFDYASTAITTYSANSLTFNPGTYTFSLGGISLATGAVYFDSSSLTIMQSTLIDPPPPPMPTQPAVAVTPEPGTLTLLGTGLLAVAEAARRRVSRTA